MSSGSESQLELTESREIGLDPPRVTISGSLCFDNAQEMLDSVRDMLAQRPKEIVMELAEAALIDSSGLRGLLECSKLCKQAGALLRLGSLSETAARIIRLAGLEEAFGLPKITWSTPQRARHADVDINQANWAMYEYVASSEASVISDLREQASKAAVEAGACGNTLCDIQIAVGEALTNAYKHGSPKKGGNKISLRCMTCLNAVVVEIEDEGRPFDPGAVCDPDPSQMRDHGMGIYLMRQAMDVVEFHTECPGNKVRMIKWINGQEPAPPDAA